MDVKPLLREHILNEILQRTDLDLKDDTPLIEDAYLTSLQAVELVFFIESQFNVEIEPEEVNEEDFYSLDTITGLVESKLG